MTRAQTSAAQMKPRGQFKDCGSHLFAVPRWETAGPWGYYLETSPDPIAMVIRVELFTHKPSETNWHCMVTNVSSVCRACG